MGMAKIRVFLVDDQALVREGVRRLLELDEQIIVVGEAESAESALAQVRARSPHVVLMDIQLPGADGIEATRQLKARDLDIKVVILSSFGDEYLSQAIEAGADGYILKTATQPDLVHAVLQAAWGASPIDLTLSREMFNQFAKMAKMTQGYGLSWRQQEILRMVAAGAKAIEIAATLAISETTLKREFRKIFDLLGVNDRAHAIAEA